MERKSFTAEVKASAEQPGEFKARVAVFGNVDKVGDKIVKGAFQGTLQPPPAGRGLPPIVWSHRWDVPPIGETLSAVETEKGLEIKGRLFVGDGEDHAIARQVYAGMKTGVLREFSFAYDVLESSDEVQDGEETRVLKQLELYEVGPTLVGVNPETELLAAAKSVELLTGLPLRPAKAKADVPPPTEPDPEPDPAPELKVDRHRLADLMLARRI